MVISLDLTISGNSFDMMFVSTEACHGSLKNHAILDVGKGSRNRIDRKP